MRKLLIIGIALIAFTSPTQSAVYIEGLLDCGQWVDARTKHTSSNFESYLIGYLNGLSLASGVEFWRARGTPISREAVFLWMDNYCKAHPLEQVSDAIFALYTEHTGQ